MKKILFSLVALVCSISMNAQVMKVVKGNTVVATYTAEQADNVVFEEAPGPTTTGTAKATNGSSEVDVNWVQLWENGPKFAEYNIGVTDGKAESYGGYYCWGSSINKDSNRAYKSGTDPLTGTDDTATNLWGSAWRLPTKTELEALRANCDVAWTTVNGVNGCKFTGKGNYASNSLFLPAAGSWINGNYCSNPGSRAYYLSSSPDGSLKANHLYFASGIYYMNAGERERGYSVRAVLAEEVPTKGTAKRTGNIDANWVQLWENGPKFAEYNVGATNNKAEDYGGYYCWGSSIDKDSNSAYKSGTDPITGTDDTATNLWGSNWRMPTKAELDDLRANCDVAWTTVNGVNGRKFTGKGDYASNSVFLPAAGYCGGGEVFSQGSYGYFLSSSPDGDYTAYGLRFNSDDDDQKVVGGNRASGCSVRAVLAEEVTTRGTAKRTGNIDVNWVQLWENGPKFAEYNVGAANNQAEGYGGYYCWGSSIDKDSNCAYKSGTDPLTGTDDTATNLWGSAWRMPTKTELEALLANCDVEWTTVNGVNGRKFTGKGDYASNSVFLPAAGYCGNGYVYSQGSYGYFWSSTPNGSGSACYLRFSSGNQGVYNDNRLAGYSIRAVLAE